MGWVNGDNSAGGRAIGEWDGVRGTIVGSRAIGY